MARLEAPVMNTRRCAPAARASSTAYWISGLSTTGSISLGMALVAGKKRVPMPATGKTALVIGVSVMCFVIGSISIAVHKALEHRGQDDLQVQPQRQVFDVMQVVFH